MDINIIISACKVLIILPIILLILISATAIFNIINIGNKDNKDILSNKNDGLVVNEEIMINEEANDVTILEDVEKEQINKLYSEEIEKAYEQAI